MRLDRFICKSTELSRDAAIERIHAGDVSVNGDIQVDESTQVHESNTIRLNGTLLTPRAFRYILMHKPAGTICSNIDEVHPSLFNFVDIERPSELHIVGRLDADTTGLVLITDDGRWSFSITVPSNNCRKVYRVGLAKDLEEDLAARFEKGLQLQGEQQLTLPAQLEIISPREALLTITEGKYHQVKRMFAAVGNRVISLHREKIGSVSLDVELGKWRYLTDDEVKSFSEAGNQLGRC